MTIINVTGARSVESWEHVSHVPDRRERRLIHHARLSLHRRRRGEVLLPGSGVEVFLCAPARVEARERRLARQRTLKRAHVVAAGETVVPLRDAVFLSEAPAVVQALHCAVDTALAVLISTVPVVGLRAILALVVHVTLAAPVMTDTKPRTPSWAGSVATVVARPSWFAKTCSVVRALAVSRASHS